MTITIEIEGQPKEVIKTTSMAMVFIEKAQSITIGRDTFSSSTVSGLLYAREIQDALILAQSMVDKGKEDLQKIKEQLQEGEEFQVAEAD